MWFVLPVYYRLLERHNLLKTISKSLYQEIHSSQKARSYSNADLIVSLPCWKPFKTAHYLSHKTLILEGRGNVHGALALDDVSSIVSWCPNLACSSSCIWPSRLCILDVYLYISNVPQKCLQEKGSCSSTSDFSIVPYMYQILPKCTTFEMLYRVV